MHCNFLGGLYCLLDANVHCFTRVSLRQVQAWSGLEPPIWRKSLAIRWLGSYVVFTASHDSDMNGNSLARQFTGASLAKDVAKSAAKKRGEKCGDKCAKKRIEKTQ